MLTEDQLASWRSDLEAERADASWNQGTGEWRAKRSPEVLGALQAHLRAYLSGSFTLPEFQTRFDKKTRTKWDIFGLKGMSAAMFLNTLVKHMPDQGAVDATLKHSLPAPADNASAAQQMTAVIDLITAVQTSGAVAKKQVQAARAPYFLSAWWHIQDRDAWPIFYPSMRRVFERCHVWNPENQDLVESYLSFRQATLSLMHALALDPWGIERLCYWLDAHPKSTNEPPTIPDISPHKSVAPAPPPNTETSKEGTTHSETQLLLARLGKKFGCKVWIAQNDHGKQWQGQRLGDLSLNTLPPLGIGDAAQAIIRLIDVIWLKGSNQVVAAFEVEHSTAIYSGLLRMSDLAVAAPNTHFPVYIVAPEDRMKKVREQLERPTFQHIELHQRCRFFSIEQLIENTPQMLKWAGDPSAIDQIAEQVGDVDESAVPPEDEEP